MRDVIAEAGPLFMGSRLKRLGEQMQAGAMRLFEAAGLPVRPVHMPLLAVLVDGPATIGALADATGGSQPGVSRGIAQLAELGLVESLPGDDLRRNSVALTMEGRRLMALARHRVWPRIVDAVTLLTADLSGDFLDQIGMLEARLAERPLDRVATPDAPALSIVEYDDTLAPLFRDINAAWIEDMFRLEDTDRDVLDNPRARIVDPGGTILFVAARGLGIVGTCALQKTGATSFELTKMGVTADARGLDAGRFLLAAMIDRAATLGADPLYLLTSARCAAAIHLYEQAGFHHDAGIMADHGARYARCDVAMRHRPGDAIAR